MPEALGVAAGHFWQAFVDRMQHASCKLLHLHGANRKPSGAKAIPSEYMGSTTTQPKGSPALILDATFKASSTGIRWFALPLKHRELVDTTQLQCLHQVQMLVHETGL